CARSRHGSAHGWRASFKCGRNPGAAAFCSYHRSRRGCLKPGRYEKWRARRGSRSGFNPDALVGGAEALPFVRKLSMQLASKMRFISAQIIALYEGDVWLNNARHSNAMAKRLRSTLEE